uniref:Immunoglobulin domain-containing protein n=1 Tax=Amphilophus citrinellus TaxID=61819 RepID=A0A3Q0RHW0_AMPCI
MKLFKLYISLLCVSGWISRSEPQTVEVQPGEDATLLCSNFSSFPSHTVWFRLVNRTSPVCISSIYSFGKPSSFCDGVEQRKTEVTSNISTIFLKIKHVDLSDSGLYFCGYYTSGYPVIVNSTYLKVQGKNSVNLDCNGWITSGETASLITLILTGVTVVLTKVIICLVVKMRLQKGTAPTLKWLCNPFLCFCLFGLLHDVLLFEIFLTTSLCLTCSI